MKRMPQAFYAKRVTEALSSVANYIEEARSLADDIQPVKEPKETFESSTAFPVPKIISVTEDDDVFTITGTGLQQVQTFVLIPAEDLENDDFKAVLGKNLSEPAVSKDKWTMEAAIDLEDGPDGFYHAWVQDKNGQEDLLLDAFEKVVEDETTEETEPEPPPEARDWTIAAHDSDDVPIGPRANILIVAGKTGFPKDIKFETTSSELKVFKPAMISKEPEVIRLPIQFLEKATPGRTYIIEAQSKLGEHKLEIRAGNAPVLRSRGKTGTNKPA